MVTLLPVRAIGHQAQFGMPGSDAQVLPPLGHILECQDDYRGRGLR